MRHSRSIELAPDAGTEFDCETIASLPEWYVLTARCGECGREVELERRDIISSLGANVRLNTIPEKLRCRPPCNNRAGNRLFLKKLAR
jgi:hypothetical protein